MDTATRPDNGSDVQLDAPTEHDSADHDFVNRDCLLRRRPVGVRDILLRCLLCAPTGRAAKRLSEATGVEAKTIPTAC